MSSPREDPPVSDPSDPSPVPTPAATPAAAPIVAGPGGEYRLKRLGLALLLLGYGVYSLYDGFYKMPRANAAAVAEHLAKMPYPAYDIPFNQVFGMLLPPAAVLLAAWVLYSARGQLQLDADDVLHVPGLPPVPLSAVTAVDRGKWDRKGIALVDYQLPDGPAGRLKLDDFLYQREPTDRIFDRVMAAVETPAVADAGPGAW